MLKPVYRRLNFLVSVVIVTLLAGAGIARAHVEIILDPFDEAGSQGVKVTDLDTVWVAVLGSDHLDVRTIKRKTVRLGSRNFDGAAAQRSRLEDVNEDGMDELLLRFGIEETDLRDAEDNTVVLTGGFVGGSEVFKSYDTITGDSTLDQCCTVAGANATGIRCEYTESLVPLDLALLVADINAIVDDDGVSISDDSAVVVEAYGGKGHDGSEIGHIHAGSGGDRGYASTLLTLSEVLDISQNQADLYIYVGQDGHGHQAGGSSSVVIGKNIFGVSNIHNPAGENVLCIGAGGGGGGKGTQTGAGKKKNGYDGGAGAIAEGSLLCDVSAAGEDGAEHNKGRGGNQDGNGAGGSRTSGSHQGKAGNDGIGGFGGVGSLGGRAVWNGSQVSNIDWLNGAGGEGGKDAKAGSGGGGFGGGGGGRGGDHKGGGGGWARQETVVSAAVRSDFILGPSFDPGYAVVYITFELVDIE